MNNNENTKRGKHEIFFFACFFNLASGKRHEDEGKTFGIIYFVAFVNFVVKSNIN